MDPSTQPAGGYQGPTPMWPQAGMPAGPPFPGFPSNQRSRTRTRTIIIASAIGAALLALATVEGIHFFGHLASTETVRVITPPPAAAGGLHQDFALENLTSWTSRIALVRREYASSFQVSPRGSAIAMYTNHPGSAAVQPGYVYVLYFGFNVPENLDTAGSIRSALRGFARHLTGVSTVAVSGGPGDTAYGCETGYLPAGPITACGWATDRTLGMMVRSGSDPQAKVLVAYMRQMRPALIRS